MGILSNLPVSDGDCADLMEDPGKVKELEKGEKGRKKKGGEGSGSGTEASESGASGAEGGKKVKPAWEKRKKKTVGAKKSKGVENIEEMVSTFRLENVRWSADSFDRRRSGSEATSRRDPELADRSE
jgi:hypothetical protein